MPQVGESFGTGVKRFGTHWFQGGTLVNENLFAFSTKMNIESFLTARVFKIKVGYS